MRNASTSHSGDSFTPATLKPIEVLNGVLVFAMVLLLLSGIAFAQLPQKKQSAEPTDANESNSPNRTDKAKAELTQIVRGQVLDRVSNAPLAGATIVLLDSTRRLGAITNEEGYFELKGVPVGRRNFVIRYLGYEDMPISNILVITGKETILNATLQEDVVTTSEVEITAETDKSQAFNSTASVSTRTFSVDEANRFAGSFGDPSRMVRNYAGVSTPNDSRNDIVIRGNSPMGMLWRFEGVN